MLQMKKSLSSILKKLEIERLYNSLLPQNFQILCALVNLFK